MTSIKTISAAFVLTAGLVALAHPAAATTSGTCFRIVGVDDDDALNLRADPNPSARIVASFTADGDPIIARDGPCGNWCRVSVSTGDGTLRGWMKSRFLKRRECP